MTTKELIHEKLSYQVVGILFGVYNQLGFGYQERYYQRAVALALKKHGLKFRGQLPIPLQFEGESIGRYFIDFVIEDSLVLEIKAKGKFHKRDILQVLGYLKTVKLPLGILANFSRDGLIFKRVLRGYSR